jgi:hypothetical protein
MHIIYFTEILKRQLSNVCGPTGITVSQEYYPTPSEYLSTTRILSFHFPSCEIGFTRNMVSHLRRGSSLTVDLVTTW